MAYVAINVVEIRYGSIYVYDEMDTSGILIVYQVLTI